MPWKRSAWNMNRKYHHFKFKFGSAFCTIYINEMTFKRLPPLTLSLSPSPKHIYDEHWTETTFNVDLNIKVVHSVYLTLKK